MTFEQLRLAPLMAQRARDLQAAHPTVQFLSGRRDLEQQAHAMACQVVTDRRWIAKTYLHAAALQTVIDQNPDANTVDTIQAVLFDGLLKMDSDELAQVSDHLLGNAVDLLPLEFADGELTPEGQGIVAWIHACPDTKKFLTREGGKVIWHWSVRESAEV